MSSVSCDEDEYHEDSLPDLVIGGPATGLQTAASRLARLDSSSSQRSTDSLDLLTLVGSPAPAAAANDDDWNESEYMRTGEEITTEVSESAGNVFKVTYMDHSKVYVPKVGGGASGHEKYRSYLSLLPTWESPTNAKDSESDLNEDDERRSKILSDFKALSYEDQISQRKRWAEELCKLDDEMAEIKELLAFKTAWCGVLRRNLGLSKWKKLAEMGEKVMQATEKTSDSFQTLLEATEAKLLQPALTSQSLNKARESFEALTLEVRERMRKSSDELAKKIKSLKVENEEEEFEETDKNSNSREKLPIVKSTTEPKNNDVVNQNKVNTVDSA